MRTAMKNKDRKIIGDLITGCRKAKVLFAAVSLGIFQLTRGAGAASRSIAGKLGSDPRATEVLLNALVAMGFLRKSSGVYKNTPISDKFLLPEKSCFLGHNLLYQNILWDAWARLEQVVKRGRTDFPLRKLLSGHKGFLDGYIRGMSDIAKRPAAQIAELFPLYGARDMLDVGGGPGTYTEALLNRTEGLRGTILDLPETLKLTKKIFKAHPLSDRIRFLAGDYHKADFGTGAYDMVLFSNVTHDEGPAENLALLRKAFRALRPGGQVIIHDFMLNSDMTGPEFSALFSVHMLVYTNRGRVYSVDEYRAWLKRAGFIRLRSRGICAGADNPSMALAGRKL